MQADITQNEVENLSERAKTALKLSGIFFLKMRLSPDAFYSVASSLGTVISDYAVRIIPNSRSYVCSAERITFHNDDLICRYIGWHCVEQDPVDGRSMLLDSRELLAQLSAEEIESLATVMVETASPLVSAGAAKKSPLVQKVDGGFRVCFVPWLNFEAKELAAQRALAKFRQLLTSWERQEKFTVFRMERGQAIFIDNLRVMHARDVLNPDSPRHLRRLWIAEPAEVEASCSKTQ